MNAPICSFDDSADVKEPIERIYLFNAVSSEPHTLIFFPNTHGLPEFDVEPSGTGLALGLGEGSSALVHLRHGRRDQA
jgi:hypothetical protein